MRVGNTAEKLKWIFRMIGTNKKELNLTFDEIVPMYE